MILSQTLLGNPEGPVKKVNPITSGEVKLCQFFPAQEIVCCETEAFYTVNSGQSLN